MRQPASPCMQAARLVEHGYVRRYMRSMQIADVVNSMHDLMQMSQQDMSPMSALHHFHMAVASSHPSPESLQSMPTVTGPSGGVQVSPEETQQPAASQQGQQQSEVVNGVHSQRGSSQNQQAQLQSELAANGVHSQLGVSQSQAHPPNQAGCASQMGSPRLSNHNSQSNLVQQQHAQQHQQQQLQQLQAHPQQQQAQQQQAQQQQLRPQQHQQVRQQAPQQQQQQQQQLSQVQGRPPTSRSAKQP